MEHLARYVNENNTIQDQILASSSEIINATYNIFLHYGLPVGYLIKTGFRKRLEKKGLDTFLRESDGIDKIIIHYFTTYGGNFDLIINQIITIALTERVNKSIKQLSKGVQKVIDFLDSMLVSSMSEALVDFCSEVCVCVNNIKPREGENIIANFIFFYLIGPKITVKNIKEHGRNKHIGLLVKTLQSIASGTVSDLALQGVKQTKSVSDKSLTKYVPLFRQILSRALMYRRNVTYRQKSTMNNISYSKVSNIFYKYVSAFNDEVPKYTGRSMSCMTRANRVMSVRTSRSFHNDMIVADNGLTEQSIDSPFFNAVPPRINFKYFALWTMEQVLEILPKYEIDAEFFIRWRITGEHFLQLTPPVLKVISVCEDLCAKIANLQRIIRKTALTIESLKTRPVSSWSRDDLCLWSILSGRGHLRLVFEQNKLDGDGFRQLRINDFTKLDITRPTDIIALCGLM